ncbi:MAG: UvrD-helicase domain-containing protein [Myxococcales bacterium]|nr:UvrD-helicase domain-containing protein [Myxococcales bacterium]
MTQHWKGDEAIGVGEVLLLEASAGTGKTFQIAQLVLRLVAEVGVTIERILTITFTTAATAELRDRIRRRLEHALVALEDAPDAPADPFLKRLSAEGRRAALPRLQNALASFDLAPISTIHGFSQRMLDLFAFESGQESGLTLLPSVTALLDELVVDELARVYATTSEAGLAVLESVGFTRECLHALARAMTGAVEPALTVSCPTAPRPLTVLLDEWQRDVAEFRLYWHSEAARLCLDAVRRDAALPAASTKGSGPKRRFGGTALNADKLSSAIDAWLGVSAAQGGGTTPPSKVEALECARTSALSRWNQPTPVSEFEGYPLFARFDALCERLDGLIAEIHAVAITGFASTIRARVEARLARGGLLTYDGMLSRLAERIEAQGPDGALATEIRGRYDVALVDEFQDTDAAQWTVLRAVFGARRHGRRLLLIGDPKQAIYRFRGADIFVYLEAAATATARHTMGTNWRSDGDYVRAMNHLWREGSQVFELDASAGGLAVDYVSVDAAAAPCRIRGLAPEPGEHAPRERRALEVRWMDRATLGEDSPDGGPIGRRITSGDDGLGLAARLCADEVAVLLAGSVQLDLGTPEAPAWTPLEPGHIAVLVRTHKQGLAVKQALARLGIPVVTAATGRIFESRVLGWVRAWLDAVAGAGRDGPARALAVTPLVGWTAQQLAAALDGEGLLPGGDDAAADAPSAPSAWTLVTSRIAAWAERWERHGFIRVFESALDECEALPRLLASPGGERLATDLRHLCELLHAEERRTRVGPGGLATWLAAQAAVDTGDETLALRLESDAHAVQIVTNHASKGLEYPIVLVPFAWAPGGRRDEGAPFLFHAPGATGTSLELRLTQDPGRALTRALHDAEEQQEELRLLYVALTRARHHAVVWYGPIGQAGGKTGASALGRLLLRGDATGLAAADACPEFIGIKGNALLAQDAVATECFDRLDALAARSEGTIGWTLASLATGATPWNPSAASGAPPTIEARLWPASRSLFSEWQIASFTSLARRAPHLFLDAGSEEPRRDADASLDAVRDALEPERPGADTPLVSAWPVVEPESARALADDTPLPLGGLIGGADTGTWIHSVFEHLDFKTGCARDGRSLEALVTSSRTRAGLPTDDEQCALVTAAVPAILATPLGGTSGAPVLSTDFCLSHLGTADRLDELRFDLRLGAGRGVTVQANALRQALSKRTDDGWGGAPWLSALLGPERSPLAGLAGILTGSIDLVFRTPLELGGRYVVVDYKTNRIRSEDGRTASSRRRDYAGDGLAGEMARHAYHLQGLLYTVALHRFLAGRLGGSYDYDRHMGGLLYLFLRGMEGAETPRTPEGHASAGRAHGVYADRWPKDVVLAVDAALYGEVLP